MGVQVNGIRSKMTFRDGRILKSLFKEESPLLR